MVKITVYQNQHGDLLGFRVYDHAGYDEEGYDIVCSAVSALTINCVNSLESLTDADVACSSDDEQAVIDLRINGPVPHDAGLLLKSYLLGVQEIENDYNRYVDVIIEEV